MMQADHKENLNLLFYDFNNGAKQVMMNKEPENFEPIVEDPQQISNGQFYNIIMSNTGSNFFSRFGDRLPTREIKSRRGRAQIIATANGGHRGASLAQSKNFEQQQLIEVK